MCSAAGTDAVDLLLLMAASENDAPKVAELIRAGATLSVKVSQVLRRAAGSIRRTNVCARRT